MARTRGCRLFDGPWMPRVLTTAPGCQSCVGIRSVQGLRWHVWGDKSVADHRVAQVQRQKDQQIEATDQLDVSFHNHDTKEQREGWGRRETIPDRDWSAHETMRQDLLGVSTLPVLNWSVAVVLWCSEPCGHRDVVNARREVEELWPCMHPHIARAHSSFCTYGACAHVTLVCKTTQPRQRLSYPKKYVWNGNQGTMLRPRPSCNPFSADLAQWHFSVVGPHALGRAFAFRIALGSCQTSRASDSVWCRRRWSCFPPRSSRTGQRQFVRCGRTVDTHSVVLLADSAAPSTSFALKGWSIGMPADVINVETINLLGPA